MTLKIDAWSAEGRFWGSLEYVGTGIVTDVRGQLLDRENERDATLTFRELRYSADELHGNVDFNGEYRMIVRGTQMSGSWNRLDGTPVGNLQLELVA